MRRLLNIPNKRSNVQPPDTFSGASTVSVYSRWKYFYLESRYFYLGSLYSTPTVTCHNTELITPQKLIITLHFCKLFQVRNNWKSQRSTLAMRITGYHQTMIFQDHKLVQLIMGLQISTFGPIFQQIFCGNGKQAILYCLKVSVNYRGFCVLLIILQFYTTMVFITLILYSLYYILSSDTDVIDRDFVQSNIPWINSCCVNACWCLISIFLKFLKFELNPVLKQMSKTECQKNLV